ncbi:hypothetical protein R3P38DRAFT_3602234 [Favolaschia claudopus]|uniref:Uncharacterized protein n=1 Tax=Favolaschia claudopus TaxID=2862362 RepID=A0AAW0ABS2_9AGAR
MARPVPPCDFRRIPLGDIYLHRELQLIERPADGTHSAVKFQSRSQIRRVYSAQIEGQISKATVAMYQGDGAEEEWKKHMAKYMAARHPNVIQLFATSEFGGIRAMIFHDDVIPLRDFLDLYSQSPMLTVYIHGYIVCDSNASVRISQTVQTYFRSTFRYNLYHHDCTLLTRRSTGLLCTDLFPSHFVPYIYGFKEMVPQPEQIPSFDASIQQAIIVNRLTLKQYHRICYWHLAHFQTHPFPTQKSVALGTVMTYPHKQLHAEHSVQIAFLSSPTFNFDSWYWSDTGKWINDFVDHRWTRVSCLEAADTTIRRVVSIDWQPDPTNTSSTWLSQANHVFRKLGISSRFDDYVVVTGVVFKVKVSRCDGPLPKGYLFLCPQRDFRVGPSSVGWPTCPAYWSFDFLGADRLSTEKARECGFPSIKISTELGCRFWDDTIYLGLRQFHQGKGFDPDSPDVALHLEQPLYQLFRDGEPIILFLGRSTEGVTSQLKDSESQNEAADMVSNLSRIVDEMPVSDAFHAVLNIQLLLLMLTALTELACVVWQGK